MCVIVVFLWLSNSREELTRLEMLCSRRSVSTRSKSNESIAQLTFVCEGTEETAGRRVWHVVIDEISALRHGFLRYYKKCCLERTWWKECAGEATATKDNWWGSTSWYRTVIVNVTKISLTKISVTWWNSPFTPIPRMATTHRSSHKVALAFPVLFPTAHAHQH